MSDTADSCFIACQETFSWYNNSIFFCRKGCEFGHGKVYDPVLRLEAEDMCKRLAQETMSTKKDELGMIEKLL